LDLHFAEVSYDYDYDSGLLDSISDELGDWEIWVGSACTYFTVAHFQVIPGTPLGVAAVLAACFASLGTKRLRSRKTA